jgi:hypothetical protein
MNKNDLGGLACTGLVVLTVGAVVGWANDFAAYQYYVTSSNEECARSGDKISSDEARSLFPELKDYIYRR